MKYIGFTLVLFFLQIIHASPPIEIHIESCWNQLDSDPANAARYGGSWVLAGVISIKKRTKEAVVLDKLILSWNGMTIDSLLGSLYRKNPGKRFLPLEDYIICDSIWNKKEQKLIYKFEQPVMLEALTELCFVLTIPDHLQPIIKSGQFELMQEELPLLITDALPIKRSFIMACK